MIKSERIAKKINEQLELWGKNHAKLVVAIDGYSGVGKTTVGDYLAKQNSEVLSVHVDDFIKHWKERKRLIESVEDKSKVFEYEWYRYDDLEKLTRAFRAGKQKSIRFKTYDYDKNDFGPEHVFDLSKKFLVIDGIFLFHPEHKISGLMDKKIYLDTDFAKADKKRISREKKKWGKEYIPESNPDNWTRYFKEAYRRYIKACKPKKAADLVFDV